MSVSKSLSILSKGRLLTRAGAHVKMKVPNSFKILLNWAEPKS